MTQIITSDKSYLKQIGKYKRPTVDESIQDNLYCKYHWPAVKKIQVGRMTMCPVCKGKQVSLPSGKPIR